MLKRSASEIGFVICTFNLNPMYRLSIFLMALGACSASKPTTVTEKAPFVYHIQPESAIDDPSFQLCNASSAYPYYGTETSSVLDKRILLEHFLSLNNQWKPHRESGYIVIRFMVNCHGQPGRYRVLSFDMNYQPKDFPRKMIDMLMDKTKELKSWNVISHEGRQYDSYCYFTFKIENGLLTDVTP
jgi:hypothetical protein